MDGEESQKGVLTRIRVGTSGYSYPWNKGVPTPFEWYLQRGFDTVEINASFYRFPSPSWARIWLKSPEEFDFAVKVHRSITHYTKLRGRAVELWSRFTKPLEAVRGKISFWLFQLPSNFHYNEGNAEALLNFFTQLNLGSDAVVEFRHPSWWRHVEVCKEVGASFCSIDAPDLPRDLLAVNDVVYVRLHGREVWYNYDYLEEELEEIVEGVKILKAKRKYIYLNNDHGMLPNGRYLMKIR